MVYYFFVDKEKLVDEILSRLAEMKNERAKYEDAWSEAMELCMPYEYNWHDLDAVPSHPKRFTSEPCAYFDTLVSGLVGYSISPSIKWFALSLQDEGLLDRYGVKDWLEKVEQTMAAAFIRSNLYKSAAPWIGDGAGIGHGVLFIGENLSRGTLIFNRINPNELYLDIDEYGTVNTVFREMRMTVRQMADMFGVDNLSENVRRLYDDARERGSRRTVLFAVYPRKEYDEQKGISREFPYAAVYIDVGDRHVISESGFHEFPYAVYEYAQYSGRAYSDSVVQQAIEDVKFLEITTETTLKIAQIAANPPVKGSPNLRNVSILPGAYNELNRSDDVLEAIKTGDNYPISLDVQKSRNDAVRKRFNVDYFQMLQSLEGKVMTATEVMELQGEKAATLSNLIVAMNDALNTIIERSFNLLMRAGRIPTPPESLADTNAAMKVDFIGPLAQAQKKYYSASSVMSAVQQAVPLIQVFPNAGDYIDADELMKKTLENSGMPQSVIREDDDVRQIRAERAAAQAREVQQAREMQAQQMLLQNADKLGKVPESGSPLAQLDAQMAGGMNAQNA